MKEYKRKFISRINTQITIKKPIFEIDSLCSRSADDVKIDCTLLIVNWQLWHGHMKKTFNWLDIDFIGGPIRGRSPKNGQNMMTSSKGNSFHVTGHLCGEFTGHRWIPLTKPGDAELWYFLWCEAEQMVEQSRRRWFETPSHYYFVTVMTLMPLCDTHGKIHITFDIVLKCLKNLNCRVSLEYSFKYWNLVSLLGIWNWYFNIRHVNYKFVARISENIRVFSIGSIECFWILPKIFIVNGRSFDTKITIYLGIYQCCQNKERLSHKGPFYDARGARPTWY